MTVSPNAQEIFEGLATELPQLITKTKISDIMDSMDIDDFTVQNFVTNELHCKSKSTQNYTNHGKKQR
jgi:hypothetical protein